MLPKAGRKRKSTKEEANELHQHIPSAGHITIASRSVPCFPPYQIYHFVLTIFHFIPGVFTNWLGQFSLRCSWRNDNILNIGMNLSLLVAGPLIKFVNHTIDRCLCPLFFSGSVYQISRENFHNHCLIYTFNLSLLRLFIFPCLSVTFIEIEGWVFMIHLTNLCLLMK